VLFEVAPPAKRYELGKDVQLHQKLEQGFAALPGVEGVAPGWTPYIADNMNNSGFKVEGEPDKGDHGGAEDVNAVGNTFFATMGIPMIAGRSFGPQDTASSPKVAIINQALAKSRFPNVNPVGKRFRTDGNGDAWVQIVGICADTRYATLRDDPPPQFFLPYVQQARVGGMTYAIRTHLPVASLVPALRDVVRSADRDLPLIDIRTQKEQIEANMQMERAFAALTSGFGVLALALACVGIYGIMAYSVAQRINEIGIRLALGAQTQQVRSMILRESTWLSAAGIVVGLAGAVGLTRLVKSMLYGVSPNDPMTLLAGIAILLAVALAASWIPARRAASVQPMTALRHE
jgi:predicted permease